MHKDKETPPLLAFPWFGAQFLSHSFLALERDPRFTVITKYDTKSIPMVDFMLIIFELQVFEQC